MTAARVLIGFAAVLLPVAGACQRNGDQASQKPATATADTSTAASHSIVSGTFGSAADPASEPLEQEGESPRYLAEVGRQPASAAQAPVISDVPEIDQQRVKAAGIRKISGKQLTLYTDLPAQPAVDELPAAFDQAVPQWCAYFEVPPQRLAQWHLVGYLIQDRGRFEATGLLPADLPPFLHGFHRGSEVWLYEQPSDYYRRHLLLHEGTHAFMFAALGGAGPPWYMEGIAELLATHRWQEGQLQLRHFPQSKEETSHWGRIKVLKDDFQAHRGQLLTDVMRYDERAHLRVEPYAWCWAAAAFFDYHPDCQAAFRQLKYHVHDPGLNFSRRFYEQLAPQWPDLAEQWQLFIANVEYGYDIPRAVIRRQAAAPLKGAQTVSVAADHGWQSSGLRLEAGRIYLLRASGRYQVKQQPRIWWCEPGGVTIQYHQGHPLGMLMAAVRDEQEELTGLTPLAHPEPIGLERELSPSRSGTLYLRINDSPAELADNAGQLEVTVVEVEE